VSEVDINKNIEFDENVNKNIEKDLHQQKVKEEVLKKLIEYRNTINYMTADAPMSILCLSKKTEALLLDNGLLRVYDLFDRDFTKIEGLNNTGLRELTARFNQFLSMF
jgi:hypothetical protein